jgi:hypothetical protein
MTALPQDVGLNVWHVHCSCLTLNKIGVIECLPKEGWEMDDDGFLYDEGLLLLITADVYCDKALWSVFKSQHEATRTRIEYGIQVCDGELT